MRKFFVILFLIIPFISFSQLNQTDSDGLRQGRWQRTYPDGRLMYEGFFKNDKPAGEWVRYYESGQIKARISYKSTSDSAAAQLFDKTGKKIAEGIYLNEKREGNWLLFANNVKVAEEEFKTGIKNGTSRKFYPTGELLEESDWKNGIEEGNYRVYFKNSKPYMQCKFSNGMRNGLCLSYYQNGRIEMEAYYKNNLRHGEWNFFSDKGDKLYTLIYEEGQLLNPEVRDSIDNKAILNLEAAGKSIPDPEKFMQDPSEYMMQMPEFR